MATKDFNVDGTIRSLSLVEGAYILQNVGAVPVRLAEAPAAAAPTRDSGAHVLRPYERIGVTVDSDGIYVWTGGGSSRVAVTEAR